MDEIEIPQYFICPISLQIMKDPVTTITGITYDRDSIEQWLFTNKNTTCPITRHPLPIDSDLTPNHTLFRLIQAWCTQFNIHYRIPTPKPPLNKLQVMKLLKDPNLQLKTIKELKLLASDDQNKKNSKCLLLQAGVPKAMILFILNCFRKGQHDKALEEALSLLQLVDVPEEEMKLLLAEKYDQLLDSLTWVLGCEVENSIAVKSHALTLLNTVMQEASSNVMERLKPEVFETIVKVLRCGTTQQGMKAGLHALLSACHWGRNRIMMVESGAVFELVEIEFVTNEKRSTELTMMILFHLCSCAEGRAQFLSHRGAVALLTERMFTVSHAVDDRAVGILSLVLSSFSATHVVLQEMLEFGTVSKLCMLVQTGDHHHGTCQRKHTAREMLKSHAHVWIKHSPPACISERHRSLLLCEVK